MYSASLSSKKVKIQLWICYTQFEGFKINIIYFQIKKPKVLKTIRSKVLEEERRRWIQELMGQKMRLAFPWVRSSRETWRRGRERRHVEKEDERVNASPKGPDVFSEGGRARSYFCFPHQTVKSVLQSVLFLTIIPTSEHSA